MVEYHNMGEMIIDQIEKIRSKKIDQMVSCEILTEAIIKRDLSYNFVEYDKIRAWAKYINLDVVINSKNTAVADVQKIYLREKEKLKQAMAKIPYRVCLTSDV